VAGSGQVAYTGGKVLVGTSSVPTFRIANADRTDSTHIITKSGTNLGASFSVVQWSGNTQSTWGNDVVLAKSFSGTVGTHTIGSSGNLVSRLFFSASDGTRFVPAASIETFIDGTPYNLGMPGRLIFSTTAAGASSPTERMRIVNSGEIGVSMTPVASNRLCVRAATDGASILADSAQAQGTGWYLFYGTSGSVAVVQAWIRGDGTYGSRPNVYGGTSDIKLKENIEPASSQWSDVKSIELVNYNFIGDDIRQLGVIAQQVETISPGLVDETKDKDSDGNETGTVTKSVKYSVLYLKAVKALQEAMERIETLEVKVAALEAS
jgi:hypothetical protein